MANDAFVPLRAEDFTDVRVPRRLLNYADLVDAITHRLAKNYVAETKGLNATGLGRYMRLRGRFDVRLRVSATAWWSHGITPLWCEYDCAEGVAHFLRSKFDDVQVDGSGKSTIVRFPVRLKAGVERDDVIDSAVEQMVRIADALKDLPVTG
ncbi:MAG: hypothetical protein OXH75_00920 [Acidobacteria bacterium]|nr:hypothetical protein [Acidobacteriota bacterium]